MKIREFSVSKSTVTGLFVGGVVAVTVGLVIAVVSLIAGVAGGAITIGGAALVAVNPGSLAWTAAGLALAAALIAAGAIAAVVSWLGALVNTVRLDDKTWFVALLALGLLGFGLIAMIAYVLAGPDGASEGASPTRPATGEPRPVAAVPGPAGPVGGA